MPPDARTYLWDARRAGERISTFVVGKTWDDYQSDVLVRSAVERQFEILGEALTKGPPERHPGPTVCRARSAWRCNWALGAYVGLGSGNK